jgi:hypothetical protein
MRVWKRLLVIVAIGLFPRLSMASGPVTWGDFGASLPSVGVPTTVSLGGGSTVDVTVTTGGTQGISAADYEDVGVAATGLSYTNLNVLGIFNGGGSGTVTTTIVYSNFQAGSAHVQGYLFVGAVNGSSSPITATSTPPGASESWPLIGSTFDLNESNAWPISWDPQSGTFATDAQIGIDSDGIVVGVGALSQYSSITISLQQQLNDGIVFSIGEEADPSTGVEIADFEGTTWGAVKALYR